MAEGGCAIADGRWQMADGGWQMADGRIWVRAAIHEAAIRPRDCVTA